MVWLPSTPVPGRGPDLSRCSEHIWWDRRLALWPISPDSQSIFLNKPNNQCDDDIPLESEPLYLQSQWVLRNACGWIQITQIVVTGNQSLEAKWAPVPGNREGRGQPNPTLSTDATNGSELAMKGAGPCLAAWEYQKLPWCLIPVYPSDLSLSRPPRLY